MCGARQRLRLQGGLASRSFADMRVDAVGEIPKRAGRAGAVAGDASAGLAIKSFLAAIESDDSLFCVAQPLTEPQPRNRRAAKFSPKTLCWNFVRLN